MEYSSNTMYFTENILTTRMPPTSATTSSSALTAGTTTFSRAISTIKAIKESTTTTTTTTMETTKSSNEKLIVANLQTSNCIFSNLSYGKPSFAEECQIFLFGSDMTLQLATKGTNTSYCLQRKDSVIRKVDKNCSQFKYKKKQFVLAEDPSLCIAFYQDKHPFADYCDPSRSYEKIMWDQNKTDGLLHI